MSSPDNPLAAHPGPPPMRTVRAVGFDRASVEPASALYMEIEDEVRVRVFNSTAGLVVRVRARLQLPNGDIVPQDMAFTPTSARALSEASFRLGEGFLLGLSVRGESAVARRGSCFVQIILMRGGALADTPAQTLIADYLAEGQLLGFPGGNIRQATEGPGLLRNILGTDPAAGVEITETVPTGARWRLQSFRMQLVTSAVVAVRRVHFVVDDGANILLDLAAADTQAASLTRNYNVDPTEFARAAQDNEIYIPVVASLILSAGFRLRTSTTLLDAGDNYGPPRYVVEEWIEP